MTRLQQEITRKAAKLGCACKYNEQDGSIQITYDSANIRRLHSDDDYTYRSDDRKTESHEKCSKKLKI